MIIWKIQDSYKDHLMTGRRNREECIVDTAAMVKTLRVSNKSWNPVKKISDTTVPTKSAAIFIAENRLYWSDFFLTYILLYYILSTDVET